MPNHCDQSVYIHGPLDLVRELYWALDLKKPRFCDVVLPVPFAQSAGMDGYNWRVENWGTKWDVKEVEIDEGGLHTSDDVPVAWFSFKCWTAWAPPVLVWDKLHEMGIEVQAEYEDEGLNFAGEYSHGEDTSWEPCIYNDEPLEAEAEEEDDWCQACEDGTCSELSETEDA